MFDKLLKSNEIVNDIIKTLSTNTSKHLTKLNFNFSMINVNKTLTDKINTKQRASQ